MIVSVTELHVRSFRYFFPFVLYSIRSMKQAKRSPGMVKTMLSNNGWRIGYTLSVWNSKEDMLAFRNSGVHKKAMTKIRKYAYRYKILRYETETIPDWKEALRRLDELPLLEL